MLLAGDIGGTKTLLGLFERDPVRPQPLVVREFRTLDFEDLPSMLDVFVESSSRADAHIESAAFGIAGPVVGDTATLTSAPWRVAAAPIAARFAIPRVRLVNDLVAMARALPLLYASERHVLQEGEARADGAVALIAPGTGLGEACLHNIEGRLIPSPSEGGNADFAARTERDIALLGDLTRRFGRARVEHVLSGPGLINIYRAMHDSSCAARINLDDPGAPAAISSAALAHTCSRCEASLDLFVEALGAEAGNLALRTLSTGGVMIGGGIAPKILPALAAGSFLRAFRAKAPLEALLARMPVSVVTNAQAGLLGAAVHATI